MEHALKPDTQGHIIVDNKAGTYKPGDTVFITGNPKDVLFSNFSGTPEARIRITNAPGETLTIGDINWSGGAYSYGLMFKNCHYITLAGSSQSAFQITGSKSDKKDANGFGVRGAYFNLRIDELSDNFIVRDLSIRYGGTGVWAKTEVTTNPKSWFPNTLDNFEFLNLDIRDTYVEGMYIGHTGTYWNIKTNQPYYPASTADRPTDTSTYKQPIKLRNVLIDNCFVSGSGFDGIQTAAIENLLVVDNEVTNWATNKNTGHNGGILIGGRVKGFTVYNNKVHDGWGEMLQVFAEGGADAVIKSNLFARNTNEGVVIRGTDGLAVTFTNNTVVAPGGTTFRVNGYFGGTGKNVVSKNLFVQPVGVGGVVYPNRYIYYENGGTSTDDDNKKLPTLAEAKLSENDFFQPLPGSPAEGYGYVHPKPEPPEPKPEETLSLSIECPTLLLSELAKGTHVVKLTLPDGTVGEIKFIVG